MEEQQVDTIVLAADLNRVFFADKGKIHVQFKNEIAHFINKRPAEIILMEGIRQIEKFHNILFKERVVLRLFVFSDIGYSVLISSPSFLSSFCMNSCTNICSYQTK